MYLRNGKVIVNSFNFIKSKEIGFCMKNAAKIQKCSHRGEISAMKLRSGKFLNKVFQIPKRSEIGELEKGKFSKVNVKSLEVLKKVKVVKKKKPYYPKIMRVGKRPRRVNHESNMRNNIPFGGGMDDKIGGIIEPASSPPPPPPQPTSPASSSSSTSTLESSALFAVKDYMNEIEVDQATILPNPPVVEPSTQQPMPVMLFNVYALPDVTTLERAQVKAFLNLLVAASKKVEDQTPLVGFMKLMKLGRIGGLMVKGGFKFENLPISMRLFSTTRPVGFSAAMRSGCHVFLPRIMTKNEGIVVKDFICLLARSSALATKPQKPMPMCNKIVVEFMRLIVQKRVAGFIMRNSMYAPQNNDLDRGNVVACPPA